MGVRGESGPPSNFVREALLWRMLTLPCQTAHLCSNRRGCPQLDSLGGLPSQCFLKKSEFPEACPSGSGRPPSEEWLS